MQRSEGCPLCDEVVTVGFDANVVVPDGALVFHGQREAATSAVRFVDQVRTIRIARRYQYSLGVSPRKFGEDQPVTEIQCTSEEERPSKMQRKGTGAQ